MYNSNDTSIILKYIEIRYIYISIIILVSLLKYIYLIQCIIAMILVLFRNDISIIIEICIVNISVFRK